MCLCGSHSITLALLAFTTSNMPLELSGLSSDTEFPELVYVEWESFEKPCCKLIRLYFPVHGDGPEARAAALKESTERQIGWHRSDPTSHWIKITDTDTGALAGASYWHIYESNPYANVSDDECTWFPAGEDREIANQLMGQFLESRMKYMAKPHLCTLRPGNPSGEQHRLTLFSP
jgi:hypothetical protein